MHIHEKYKKRSFKIDKLGAREKAQVSCLLYKCKNLNSDPQYPQKKLGMADACFQFQKAKSGRSVGSLSGQSCQKCATDAVIDLVSRDVDRTECGLVVGCLPCMNWP